MLLFDGQQLMNSKAQSQRDVGTYGASISHDHRGEGRMCLEEVYMEHCCDFD